MKLDGEVIGSLKTARVFKDNTQLINSIDFSPNGELCVTSGNDELISVYNCNDGSREKQLPAKKYGVNLIRFTHDSKSVIHASNVEWSDDIRYLSLHDLKYMRYFKGHRKPVTSLAMSPVSDHFTSASLDGTVRFWDLRASQCQGVIRPGAKRSVVAYDPQGSVFACGFDDNTIKLYDVQNYDKGPFATFNIQARGAPHTEWSTLTFSPCGNFILGGTLDGALFLVDAFDGRVLQHYGGTQKSSTRMPIEATFTPDAQFVLSGSEEGVVYAWEAQAGGAPTVLAAHNSPVSCVKWNPKKMMMASACCSLAFWLPSKLK